MIEKKYITCHDTFKMFLKTMAMKCWVGEGQLQTGLPWLIEKDHLSEKEKSHVWEGIFLYA